MKQMIILITLIATPVLADTLKSRAQVRQTLVDNGKIASLADDSLDGDYEILSIGGDAFLTVRAWNSGTLGTQPAANAWPDDATAQTDLSAAESAIASVPFQPSTGIAIEDEVPSHWYKLVVVNGVVTPVQISSSPVDPATWQAQYTANLADAQAEVSARQAAITELNLTQAQVDAITSFFNADIDTLFGNLTANQRAYLTVQRALVKALAKREIAQVR